MGKHLLDKDIVAQESDELGDNQVSIVGWCKEDGHQQVGVDKDMGHEGLSLGNGEAEEVEGDFIGGDGED